MRRGVLAVALLVVGCGYDSPRRVFGAGGSAGSVLIRGDEGGAGGVGGAGGAGAAGAGPALAQGDFCVAAWPACDSAVTIGDPCAVSNDGVTVFSCMYPIGEAQEACAVREGACVSFSICTAIRRGTVHDPGSCTP